MLSISENYDGSDNQVDDECDNSASFSELARRVDGTDSFPAFSSKLSKPLGDVGNSNHDREDDVVEFVKSSHCTSESKDAESERNGDHVSKRKRKSTMVPAKSYSFIAKSSVNSTKGDPSLLLLLNPCAKSDMSSIIEMKAKSSFSQRHIGRNNRTNPDGMNIKNTKNGTLSSFLRSTFAHEDQSSGEKKPLSRTRLLSSASCQQATTNLDNGRNQRRNRYGLLSRSHSDEQLDKKQILRPEATDELFTTKRKEGSKTKTSSTVTKPETDEKVDMDKLLQKVGSIFRDSSQNALLPAPQEIRMIQDEVMKRDQHAKREEHDDRRKNKGRPVDKIPLREPSAELLELPNDFSNKEEKQEENTRNTKRHWSIVRKEVQSREHCFSAITDDLTRSHSNKLFPQLQNQEEEATKEYPFIAHIHRNSHQVNGGAAEALNESFLQLEIVPS